MSDKDVMRLFWPENALKNFEKEHFSGGGGGWGAAVVTDNKHTSSQAQEREREKTKGKPQRYPRHDRFYPAIARGLSPMNIDLKRASFFFSLDPTARGSGHLEYPRYDRVHPAIPRGHLSFDILL